MSTPADQAIKLHHDASSAYHDIFAYRRLVDHLLYLTTTTFDITFITQQSSQYLTNPTISHHNATIHVIRYLKGCPARGLFFSRYLHAQLIGFLDAD